MKKILVLFFVLACGFGMVACDKKKKGTTTEYVATNSNPQMQFANDEAMFNYMAREDASYYSVVDLNMATLGTSNQKMYVEGNKIYTKATTSVFGMNVETEQYLVMNGTTVTIYTKNNGTWESKVETSDSEDVTEDYTSSMDYSDLTYKDGKYSMSSTQLALSGMTKYEITINSERTQMTMLMIVDALGITVETNIVFSHFGQISVTLPQVSGGTNPGVTTVASGSGNQTTGNSGNQTTARPQGQSFASAEAAYNYMYSADASFHISSTTNVGGIVTTTESDVDGTLSHDFDFSLGIETETYTIQGTNSIIIYTNNNGTWEKETHDAYPEEDPVLFSDFEYNAASGKYILPTAKCTLHGYESLTLEFNSDFSQITVSFVIVDGITISGTGVYTSIGAVTVSLPSGLPE